MLIIYIDHPQVPPDRSKFRWALNLANWKFTSLSIYLITRSSEIMFNKARQYEGILPHTAIS